MYVIFNCKWSEMERKMDNGKIPFFLTSPLIPFWSEQPVYDENIMADINCILWVGCSIIKSRRYDLSYNRNFYMVFKATITIEWNGWGQSSCSMAFRWLLGPANIVSRWFSMVVHHRSNDAIWWTIVPVYPETISLWFLLQSLQVEGRKYIFFV